MPPATSTLAMRRLAALWPLAAAMAEQTETLEEVIEHYSSGIKQSSTLDPGIEFAGQGGVQLDEFEKGLIKKFLLTLTDEEFLNNPKFARPQ